MSQDLRILYRKIIFRRPNVSSTALQHSDSLVAEISVMYPEGSASARCRTGVKATKAPEGVATGATTGGVAGGVLGLLAAAVARRPFPAWVRSSAAGLIMATPAGRGFRGAHRQVGASSAAWLDRIPEIEAKIYESKLRGKQTT